MFLPPPVPSAYAVVNSANKPSQLGLVHDARLIQPSRLDNLAIHTLIPGKRRDAIDIPILPKHILGVPPSTSPCQLSVLEHYTTDDVGRKEKKRGDALWPLANLNHRHGRCLVAAKRGLDVRPRGPNVGAPRLLGLGVFRGDEDEKGSRGGIRQWELLGGGGDDQASRDGHLVCEPGSRGQR